MQTSTLSQDEVVKALYVAEFHDVVGKQIFFSYPQNNIQEDITQNQILDLLIPKDELCGRVIVFEFTNQYHLVNLPVLLKHDTTQKPYQRGGKYIFSIAMQVKSEAYKKCPQSFKEAIRKLGFLLTVLENNTHCVYNHQDSGFLKPFQKAFEQLNSDGQSTLEFDDDMFVFIRFQDPPQVPTVQEIKLYNVPFPLFKLNPGISTQFDPVLEKLLPEIDGTKCVGTIIENLEKYTKQQICKSLQDLLKGGLVTLVDIISLTNRYVLTEEAHNILRNQQIIEMAISFIKVPFVKQNFWKKFIQALYFGFRKDIKLSQYIQNNQKLLLNVNLYRLIRFGQINKIIYRIHEYAIKLRPDQTKNFFDRENAPIYLQNWIHPKYRFREEEPQKEKPLLQKSQKPLVHHCVEHSLEYSQLLETQIKTNLFHSGPLKLNLDEQIIQANRLLNQQIFDQVPADEICLFFNMDLESFQKFCRPIEIYLINK